MKKLLLFTLLLSQIIFPQLKEMEVKPTENRGGIPIFRDFPDKAGIIFYTQYDNLTFYSSYGVHNVMGDPASGKYVVIVEPARQSLEIRCPGHKSEIIKLSDLQPRDVLYYEVLPKKEEGLQGISEIAITVQATPMDASIFVDGSPVKNDTPTKLSIGNHNLRVEKSGYSPYLKEIDVNPANTIFKINLEKVNLVQVLISSEPQGAEIRINNEAKGVTNKGFFLFPGEYELNLSKDEHLPVNQKITVGLNENQNKFTYKLTKNRGYLNLTVSPSGSKLKINGVLREFQPEYELAPGSYELEVYEDLYLPWKENLEIKLGERIKRDIKLDKNFGTLKLSIKPTEATLRINGEVRSIEGSYNLAPGRYVLEISAQKHLTIVDTVAVKIGETVSKSYNLTKNRGYLSLDVSPNDALVKLNNERITAFSNLELLPGSYEIEVTADKYLSQSDKIDLKIGDNVSRKISLVRNTGKLTLKFDPVDADIKVNRERFIAGNDIELTPGLYEITIEKETYRSQTFSIEIKRGDNQTKQITLMPITGGLQFSVSPFEAEVILSRDGKEVSKWNGLKLLESLRIGEYDLSVKLKGYKSIQKKVMITEGKQTSEDLQMTPGSDSPEGMVLVEGGTFQMGSNNGGSDERPIHQVTVSSYLISKYEVTQELWESVMGSNPSNFKGSRRPVETVSWYEVVEFCNKLSEKEGLTPAYTINKNKKDPSNDSEYDELKWLVSCDFTVNGYRLPTEAEWEYAARGGNKSKGYKYSGSNTLGGVASYSDNSRNQTNVAGSKGANELGIYDMSGNVWEWCWDWSGDYTSGSQTDPKGASSGINRVLRGGSWYYSEGWCRVAERSSSGLGLRNDGLGFRLVRTK